MNIAPPSQRHFVALQLDDAAARRVAAVELPEDARPVPAADLHVTLAFLDTLEPRGEDGARAAMAEAMQDAAPPRIHLDRIEAWRESLVLCAAPSSASEALGALASALKEGLARRGLRVEVLPFRAHVTVARLRRRSAEPARLLRQPIVWQPLEIVMLASRAGPPVAPRYHVLHRVPFGSAPPDS